MDKVVCRFAFLPTFVFVPETQRKLSSLRGARQRILTRPCPPGYSWPWPNAPTDDNASALASLDHVLQIDPRQLSALIERAEIRLATGDKERALG